MKNTWLFPPDTVLVQTANKVPPFAEIACVATSLSPREPPSTTGEDQELPLLVVSTATASHGDEELLPVLTYQATKAVLPEVGIVTGHELS